VFVLQTNVEQTRLHKRYHKEPEGQDGDIVNFEEGLSQAWRQQRSGMPGHNVPLAEFYFFYLVSARTDFSSVGDSITRRARACAHEDALGTFQVHVDTQVPSSNLETLLSKSGCKAYASNTIEERADTWRQTEGGAKRRLAWGEQWRRYRHECGR
jgi:hypothetical protein